MRNDPPDQSPPTNTEVGRGAVITGYAAFGLALVFLVALLVVDHHEMTNVATDTAAAEAGSFGIEELVDLFTSEPTVSPPAVLASPKPRPVTRAELDPKHRR